MGFGASVRGAIASSSRGPLRTLWALVYRALIVGVSRYLRHDQDVLAVYLRGSVAQGDARYGVSDIDLVAVPSEDAAESVRGRWELLCRKVPLDRIVSVGVWSSRDLAVAAGATAFTLDAAANTSAMTPALVRPGLYGPGVGWRHVGGSDLRPPAIGWDEVERRLVAWGEVQQWWRFVFRALAEERRAGDLDYLWFKFVVEHARVVMWLEQRQMAGSRADVLASASTLFPDDREPLDRAFRFLRHETSFSAPEALSWALRVVARVARSFEESFDSAGSTRVELVGLDGYAGGVRPLMDWHARVFVHPFDGSLSVTDLDATDPQILGAQARRGNDGSYPAIVHHGILLLPAVTYRRCIYRTIQSRISDPVSFAVLEGRNTADFPNVRGWSVADCARRAVEEHLLWLRLEERPSLRTLGKLFSASRAGALAQSVAEDRPMLPIDAAGTALYLENQIRHMPETFDSYRLGIQTNKPVDPRLVERFRKEVLAMPAYAQVTGE